MLTLQTELGKVHIVEHENELPDIYGEYLYSDAETTSFSDVPAFEPYSGHRSHGWAITYDDCPDAWYVPIRHWRGKNIAPEAFFKWYNSLPFRAWVNHNVKFDAHFSNVDGVDWKHTFIDTVVGAKMLDSDRMNHQLKSLSRDWLGLQMEDETKLKAYLKSIPTQNYARLPIDMCGKYAAMDVFSNRLLFKYIEEHIDESQYRLWTQGQKVTRVLYEMEKHGLHIDVALTKMELHRTLKRMVELEDLIEEHTGIEYADSNTFHSEVLLGHLQLPILAYGKPTQAGKRNASFDKDAMKLYRGHPGVVMSQRATTLVDALIEMKTLGTYRKLFLVPFLEKHVDGKLYSNYNQLVRTGRMSCKNPNTQQFDPRARTLVIAPPGYTFVCADASQLEFRLIAHYIRDPAVIQAYTENAATDFHQWVADLCGIKRGPGKTINFAMAYGATRGRVTHQLQFDPSIMEELKGNGDACRQRAEEIYQTYHERLPGIKNTSRKAVLLCKERGWIRNAYGRRRHIPTQFAYKAFNSLVQGCAGDLVQEQTIRTSEYYRPEVRDFGATLLVQCHDELLWALPDENAVEFAYWVRNDLSKVEEVELRVPIKWDVGIGRNWQEAKTNEID